MTIQYRPCRKKETGRWDMVEFDLGHPLPAGYCRDYYFKEERRDGHHATCKEAIECFMQYALDHIQFDGMLMTPAPCLICGKDSWRAATLGKEPFMTLCPEHLNKNCLELIRRGLVVEVDAEFHDNEDLPPQSDDGKDLLNP